MTDHLVLIVDDDASFRDMLMLVLGGRGYRTEDASDGLEALDRIRTGDRPSLVIADLRMPRMNGIELVRALRADPAYRRIPVIIMTGDVGGTIEALAAGASEALCKPVETQVLLDAVRHHAA